MEMSSYPQFGYNYHSASSPPSSQMVGGGSESSGGGSPGPGQCCEGRPLLTDPVSGQAVCSCQYEAARLATLPSYRPPPPAPPVYSTHYPSTDQNPYPSIESSPFYSPLSTGPYGLKEGATGGDMGPWPGGLQPSSGYYPYDPTLAAYGYGAGYDLAARRKNATRESTATLKAWLNEHKKNPYPTKGEKIMLAIITKMTLTQVSTWFANARRRLKKENKMTWEPKNKTEDDDEPNLSDCDDKDNKDTDKLIGEGVGVHVKAEERLGDDDDDDERKTGGGMLGGGMLGGGMLGGMPGMAGSHLKGERLPPDCGVPLPPSKPKIWSLADTAACKTPPPPWGQAWGRYPWGPEADTPPQTPPGQAKPSYQPHYPPSYYRPQEHHQPPAPTLQSQPPPPHTQQPPPQQDDTAFKPFYKSSSQMNGGYVSPV